jgi:hypothetical protein
LKEEREVGLVDPAVLWRGNSNVAEGKVVQMMQGEVEVEEDD